MEDDLRIEAVQSIVKTWSPRDERGRDSKKRFESVLKKMMESSEGYGEPEDEVHVTSSAVVLGPEGTLLYGYEARPAWSTPGGNIAKDESPWKTAERETREKTGVVAHHPENGPVLVDAEVQQTPDGHTHLDLRFLLFADDKQQNYASQGSGQSVHWYSDEEAKAIVEQSYRHSLEIAHVLRDEALR